MPPYNLNKISLKPKMASKPHSNIVRTPIQLQLEKLNQFSIMQQKNIEVEYHLLRLLNEIVINSPEIVNTPIFLILFNEMMNYEQIEQIKMLPLYEMFGYRLWSNESFYFQVREKTSFYSIISSWIIYFELKSGNLQGISNKFELISNFMAKETRTGLERMVMMEEIYEDLKDFIDEYFWQEEEHITSKTVQSAKEQEMSQPNIVCITKVLEVVEAIVNPIYYRVHPKESTYKNCTYGNFKFYNSKEFVKKSLYFLLKHRNIPSHLQTEISKIALIHLQSLDKNCSKEIVNMLKHLMLSTSKPVRFALIIEYVQFYEYLEMMGFEEVIEQLQSMIYFRELIIGKKMVEENIVDIGNSMNDLNLSYHELYVKAGTSKKIYFSNQSQENILKLDVLLEENDINLKISHYNAIKVEKPKGKNINKFVYDIVEQLNHYDASKLQGEKSYWKEERSTSKKLELKLQYQGLFCIEFDNCYSWVIPKNVKYRLEIYQPFK